MKKILQFIIIISSICLLSACGYKLRSGYQLPHAMHKVYLQTAQPYNPFITDFRASFTGLGIDFVSNPSLAPMTFEITNITYQHDTPSVTTSSQAVTVTYNLTVTYQLLVNSKVIAGPYTDANSQEVILNASQVMGQAGNPELRNQLQQTVINQIYNRLSSIDIRNQINKALPQGQHAS